VDGTGGRAGDGCPGVGARPHRRVPDEVRPDRGGPGIVEGRRLLAEWEDLLRRRPTFRETLEPFGRVIRGWAEWIDVRPAPLRLDAQACHARWSNGEPLLAEAALKIAPASLEILLDTALEVLAGFDEDVGEFAASWDRGELDPSALFPRRGRIGSIEAQERSQLSQDALAFLAVAALRPVLAEYFAECREHIPGSAWDLGICPCCGAPPAFADLLEDGRRQLACHVCDTSWTFARLMCPFCGTRAADDVVRLVAEDAEEGYAVSACRSCRGYVKELDRRVRWNAGCGLVEDWGSPHLDLIAHRQEFWRPIPTLIQLASPVPPAE
jgi:formate dehydrogenase maturation protein FdhE